MFRGCLTPLNVALGPSRDLHSGDPRRDGADGNERVHAHMWKQHFRHGLDQAAFLVCMLLDTIYPTVTRTLLQILRCHPLEGAGVCLEADARSRAVFSFPFL